MNMLLAGRQQKMKQMGPPSLTGTSCSSSIFFYIMLSAWLQASIVLTLGVKRLHNGYENYKRSQEPPFIVVSRKWVKFKIFSLEC